MPLNPPLSPFSLPNPIGNWNAAFATGDQNLDTFDFDMAKLDTAFPQMHRFSAVANTVAEDSFLNGNFSDVERIPNPFQYNDLARNDFITNLMSMNQTNLGRSFNFNN
jgi:hypothetical protein